jgi:hypothetical protein
MQVTVQIHEAWLARPEDLRRVLALLAGLEAPAPSAAGHRQATAAPAPDPDDYEESSYPEDRAPARREPDRGDAWEPPADEPDKDAPRDGRQLLGWASKQVPDLKGVLIGYGKKRGLHSKIVEWTPQQVAEAYRFARRKQPTTR